VSKGRWAVPGYKVRLLNDMEGSRREANNPTGEVRRSVRPLSIFFPSSQNVPDLGCITYVFVNSSGEWKCILDFDHELARFQLSPLSCHSPTNRHFQQYHDMSPNDNSTTELDPLGRQLEMRDAKRNQAYYFGRASNNTAFKLNLSQRPHTKHNQSKRTE
jgi:hypothetical protein